VTRDVSAGFKAEKNKETNQPIWLYQVEVEPDPNPDDVPDLFIAEYDEDIDFPVPPTGSIRRPSGTVYQAFPLQHEGVEENIEGRIDEFQVTMGNVDRTVQAYLEQRDGLRGRKVTVRLVFYNHLDDSSACIEDVFYVDSVSVGDRSATFRLTSKLDIMRVELPRRRFSRNFCAWEYKREGCWLSSDAPGVDWEAPEGFVAEDTNVDDECDKRIETCALHNNRARFGGFPSIPTGRTTFV